MRKSQFRSVVLERDTDFDIHFDDVKIGAYSDETVIAALLRERHYLSRSEFDGLDRAGFCLMGACQDCSVWTANGQRLRACSTFVEAGMRLLSKPPMRGFSV